MMMKSVSRVRTAGAVRATVPRSVVPYVAMACVKPVTVRIVLTVPRIVPVKRRVHSAAATGVKIQLAVVLTPATIAVSIPGTISTVV
jgi:hypothetical protein